MRMRSHYNPFSVLTKFKTFNPVEHFDSANNPLVLEIGFAGGAFLLDYCSKNKATNLVGLEIRKPLVLHVEEKIQEAKLNNAKVWHATANTALKQLFPKPILDEVYIFFPDPWRKKKHLNRRVVNSSLVKDISNALKPGGIVFIQTDVDYLGQDIQSYFEQEETLVNANGPKGWEKNNHTGSITERESYCIEDNDPIYRLLYKKPN